jgi:hypothetical protein
VKDSLTPASRLYTSPSWAFFIVVLGADAAHSGLLYRGTLARDDVGRFAKCLGPARQFPGGTERGYVALGDTVSADSAAYQRTVNQLAQGGDAMRVLLVSLARGDSAASLPGLVGFGSPSFDPTVSVYGRGGSAVTAILRHWSWRDGGSTFAEDTAHASLVACNLS